MPVVNTFAVNTISISEFAAIFEVTFEFFGEANIAYVITTTFFASGISTGNV